MFVKDGKRFSIDVSHEINGIVYTSIHFRDPVLREQFGIIEIPDPVPPIDFSDDVYYVTHQDESPFTVWTKKPQEQIDQAHNNRVQQVIDTEERNTMLPRATREFMLAAFEAQALAAGVDPILNAGYVKMKELDTKIADLRRSKK